MMKYALIGLMLLVGMQQALLAQDDGVHRKSKAEMLFNMNPPFVNNIHTAHLLKGEAMIIELADLNDYDLLNNLDSIMEEMMKDIEFYKDSMPVTGNIRIDYVITEDSREKIMRFVKYPSSGDLYVKQNIDIARLKLDQDTVHIILQKKPNDRSNHAHFYDFPAQVTFCLNNYADIDTLLNNKGFLRSIVDTLKNAIPAKKINPEHDFPYGGPTQSTVDYYPYSAFNKMRRSSVILPHGKLEAPMAYNRNKFAAYGNFSAGLIRNTFAPGIEAGISHIKFDRSPYPDHFYFTSLYLSSVYFFSSGGDGGQVVNDNYFVNIESGSAGMDDDMLGVKVRSVSLGGGYLIISKGDYFKANTFRLFMGLRLGSGLSVYPELIGTNNLKQIFPGMTLKIFGFKREQHLKLI
jgi:hypothetical protein